MLAAIACGTAVRHGGTCDHQAVSHQTVIKDRCVAFGSVSKRSGTSMRTFGTESRIASVVTARSVELVSPSLVCTTSAVA